MTNIITHRRDGSIENRRCRCIISGYQGKREGQDPLLTIIDPFNCTNTTIEVNHDA